MHRRPPALTLFPYTTLFRSVGLVAGAGMWFYARSQEAPSANPILLGAIVWFAMIGSCVASGVSGALVPLTLKRFGADPATASRDRKSTRLNSSHGYISYAVF